MSTTAPATARPPAQPGADVRILSAAGASTRVATLDAIKGLGIVLVVVGHAIVGLVDAGKVPVDGWLADLNYGIYLFHMPLFFLLSGLFIHRRLGDAPRQFSSWLGLRFAWPYLLWSTLQLATIHAAGQQVNHPTPWSTTRLLELLWAPVSQYWFLHALMLFHTAAWVSGRLGWRGFWLPAACVVTLAWVVSGGDWPWVNYDIQFLGWYALGAQVSSNRALAWLQRLQAWHPLVQSALACVALFVAQAWLLRAQGVFQHSPAALGAQAAGVGSAVLLVMLCPPLVRQVLAWLGQRSMSIFLLHVLAVAGTRIVLLRSLDQPAPELVLLAAVCMGLAFPLLVNMAAQRLGLGPALGLDRG